MPFRSIFNLEGVAELLSQVGVFSTHYCDFLFFMINFAIIIMIITKNI